ncbi:uncharacterized protein BCR38DRAFT_481950 [Pseudomassariella vexata]|uniref:Uncharacterized protein n=1 Tax=Pseudomassariella vexata TaxID=1141098 RepID=A0A1Y2EAY5_9PEZI|nr:uncharacterized protein BCR38DRAFT_481950 [Pseudomassariella vexata]ORY68464.1 hypothetical protein BCR38DRAFT_481950 [Pseudomassariella vexata]
MYSEAIKFLNQGGAAPSLRLCWAGFHSKVRGELSAKELLYQALDFNTSRSQMATPLALTTRKLEPIVQFQEILTTIFDGCIANLSDSTGWNDCMSFRTLAKVLFSVGSLGSEAQMAACMQINVVDIEIYKRGNTLAPDLDSATENGETVDSNEMPHCIPKSEQTVPFISTKTTTSGASLSEDTTSNNGEAKSPSAPSAQEINQSHTEPRLTESDRTISRIWKVEGESTRASSPESVAFSVRDSQAELNQERDEDTDTSIICSECDKVVSSGKQDSTYICLYCIEADLWGECFDKRARRQKGELEVAWRTVCPRGRKQTKALIEGWGGVNNGVITMGEEKISFKDWLKELKDVRWPNAWKAFWAEELG